MLKDALNFYGYAHFTQSESHLNGDVLTVEAQILRIIDKHLSRERQTLTLSEQNVLRAFLNYADGKETSARTKAVDKALGEMI